MTMAVTLRDVFCVHRTSEGDAAALQGATLDVAAGELVCVLGPSGAGKSTLLRVIAGLQTPSAGEVRVMGQEIGRQPERLRARLRHARIGFLGESAAATLSPALPVSESVALPIALRGASRSRQRARSEQLLRESGLDHAGGAYPGELSGGERQRAALCVALAHAPELLLADEPTGELDQQSALEIRAVILELCRAQGTTAIIVSHDFRMAEIADRSLRIRDGRLVEESGSLVVGRDGWVRLPPEMLAAAGIGDRIEVRADRDGLIVTAANQRHGLGGALPVATPAPAPRAPPEPARIELRSVSKGYGPRPILDALRYVIAPGRMTAVTGRSGSGKTTLLTLLAGLQLPDDGELVLDGEAVASAGAERRATLRRERIGYLPQEPAPVGFLSAHENVVLVLRLRGWGPRAAAARAAEAIAAVGLAERSRQRVSRLSAGEAQRVALARALASARGLLIVDEPTSRLDEPGTAAVAALLADVAAREGQTVVCATHDEQVIARADELLALTSLRTTPARSS